MSIVQTANRFTKKKGSLTLIRHGSTKLNSEDKIRGWSDPHLDNKGEQEATETGKQLKGAGLDGLITSDLDRAKATAKGISKVTGVPIIGETPGLRPWNLGNYTGKPVSEANPVMQNFAAKTPDKPVPGGESFNSFKNRFLNTAKSIIREHQGKHIGIVTHSRGDRIMQAWEDAGMPDDNSINIKSFLQKGIDPGAFREVSMPPSKKKIQFQAVAL